MEQPGYGDFLIALGQFLAERPEARILCIVESNRGFETMRNDSPVWCIGALQMTGRVIERVIESSRDPEAELRRQHEEESKIQTNMRANKGTRQ